MNTEIKIEIYLSCSECGKELDFNAEGDSVRVYPCEKCVEVARDEGYTEGLAHGAK